MRNPLSDWFFHVALAWAIIFMICMASPVKAKEWPTHDRWGNKYPEECRRDLNDVPAHFRFEPLGYDGTKKTLGYFMPSRRGSRSDPGTIFIDPVVRDPVIQAEVYRHEACHALMWYLTGNLHWH